MLPDLDPLIHQPARLRLMGLLHRHRRMAYAALRDAAGLTDGNMSTHVARLVQAGYVRSGRTLGHAGFLVVVEITQEGSTAFAAYLHALQAYLEDADNLDPAP